MSAAAHLEDEVSIPGVGPRCKVGLIDSYGLGPEAARRPGRWPDEAGAFCVREGIEGIRFIFRRVTGDRDLFDVQVLPARRA